MNLSAMKRTSLMKVKEYSPEILTISGILGMLGGTCMACKATTKLGAVLDRHREDVAVVREKHEQDTEKKLEGQDLTKVYAATGLELAKLYGPTVVLDVVSSAAILSGNHILRKRNVALSAAYATLSTGFMTYRGRVINRYGEEADRELRMGTHKEKIEVLQTDENGKTKKVKQMVTVVDDGPSDYARYFAYGEAKAAEPSEDYNRFFLKAQQELANQMLMAKEFLFLNDVYEMLGIEKSIAGQAVGWVYDRNSEDHGDNQVDFGIQEVYRKRSDEPGDYEKVFLLDFNVDGSILDHAQKKGLITR